MEGIPCWAHKLHRCRGSHKHIPKTQVFPGRNPHRLSLGLGDDPLRRLNFGNGDRLIREDRKDGVSKQEVDSIALRECVTDQLADPDQSIARADPPLPHLPQIAALHRGQS